MATLGKCIADEHLNWTLSIRASKMEELWLSLNPHHNDKMHLETLFQDAFAQARQAMTNVTIGAASSQGNLTGEALKWYTAPWLNIDLFTGPIAYAYVAILGLVLLGTTIWTVHRCCEEFASNAQRKCPIALQWTAIVRRAGFLVAVYSTFLVMDGSDEGDREQAMAWQWWASVTIGCGLLAWWVVWFLVWSLGWLNVQVVLKLKANRQERCRELLLFEESAVEEIQEQELWRGESVQCLSPGAWIV